MADINGGTVQGGTDSFASAQMGYTVDGSELSGTVSEIRSSRYSIGDIDGYQPNRVPDTVMFIPMTSP